MADALLYIVLERLASVTEQQIRKGLHLVLGVEAEIRSFTHTLRSIRNVLEDAERRQVEDKSVEGWLEMLKDMAYEMDDVVDEWSTAILRLQIQGAENASMSQKKVSSSRIPSPSCFRFKKVASRRDIALKIKGIKQQLDAIDSERARFNFAPTRSEERPQRLITTSAIDISEVCGRDMDLDTILDHVLGRSCSEKFVGLYIISIVGTGGMGKTTLAQLAYNHSEVKAHFDERIWVCVSDPFDPIKVFRSIVEILQKESCNLHDLEALQQKVQTCVSRKKFLLILDDVWTKDYRLWEQLKNTLNNGVVGSRILVTTRNENVVMTVGTAYRHPIQELSPQHAQTLFHQIAFRGKSREKEEELKEIGEKIADRCKGLPLALKTLGNLMRLKYSKEEWEAVLDNEVWKLDVFETTISPALLLSYYELPPPIKRCFSYCAVFPKDTVIEVDKLIKLWMAQSYLIFDASKDMETLGREYFNYLAAGSFFQDFEKDEEDHVIKCKMHDIVHDLAQVLSKNECFSMEVENENEGRIDLSFQKRRHATILVPYSARNCMLRSSTTIHPDQSAQNCMSIYKMKNLCSLLLEWKYIIPEVLPNLFRDLTCLRAIDLRSDDSMTELPREIGKLIHLRYLNVSSWWLLQSLPDTICDLYNLQTLNISECHCLYALPQAMHKLINLRHLQNSGTLRLKGLPQRIERLTSLWTLDEFIVSDRNDQYCKIEDLRHLNNIRGKLKVRGLGEVRNAMEAKTAEMKNKIYLQDLTLNFDLMGTKDVVEALQPPPNLKSLTIIGYGDTEWPNWMMKSSILTQLKNLMLSDCKNCSYVPSLGELRLLEKLEVWDMDSVRCLGSEFLGSSPTSFLKLKRLSFNNMKAWEKWEVTAEEEEGEERSVMPCLRHLEIYNCQKLDRLPDRVLHIMTPLQELIILSSEILRQRYRKDKGEDWQKVSHIPLLKGRVYIVEALDKHSAGRKTYFADFGVDGGTVIK